MTNERTSTPSPPEKTSSASLLEITFGITEEEAREILRYEKTNPEYDALVRTFGISENEARGISDEHQRNRIAEAFLPSKSHTAIYTYKTRKKENNLGIAISVIMVSLITLGSAIYYKAKPYSQPKPQETFQTENRSLYLQKNP